MASARKGFALPGVSGARGSVPLLPVLFRLRGLDRCPLLLFLVGSECSPASPLCGLCEHLPRVGQHLRGRCAQCKEPALGFFRLDVMDVDLENNVVAVRGSVPGHRNAYLVVRPSLKM